MAMAVSTMFLRLPNDNGLLTWIRLEGLGMGIGRVKVAGLRGLDTVLLGVGEGGASGPGGGYKSSIVTIRYLISVRNS